MQIVSLLRRRGLLWPLLFVALSFSSLYAQNSDEAALENVLAKSLESRQFENPTWKALLHLHKNKNDISDPGFYVQRNFIDSRTEFEENFRYLFLSSDKKNICRFPARAFWFQQNLSLPPVDFSGCTDLQKFVSKAPMDSVAVVFASENLSSPTSMMGHIFIKISGKNSKNETIEHAISFFTNIQNVSFPELAFKSLLTGMKGYYSLSPFSSQKNAYLYNEQRNIWEYELPLSNDQKKLLQYHLYELRPIAFTYFFHAFNCATLINNIVAVSFSEIKEDRHFWVTPLDVIRSLRQRSLIEETHVYPASQWILKSLQQSYTFESDTLALIKKKKYKDIHSDKFSSEMQFSLWALAQSYNNYLFEENNITYEEWSSSNQFITEKKQLALQGGVLDLSHFKKPADTIQDTQIFIGYSKREKKNLILLGLLPTSHGLEDDTTQYNNESELKLGEVIASFDEDEKKIRLDKITIYSAASFNPANKLTGGLSGKFNIGYGPSPSPDLHFDHAYYLEAGIGKTFRLKNDIDFFVLANAGLKVEKKFMVYGSPEVGAFIREIGGMKSILSYAKVFSTGTEHSTFDQFKLVQALNFGSYTIDLEWQELHKKTSKMDSYSFLLKKIF